LEFRELDRFHCSGDGPANDLAIHGLEKSYERLPSLAQLTRTLAVNLIYPNVERGSLKKFQPIAQDQDGEFPRILGQSENFGQGFIQTADFLKRLIVQENGNLVRQEKLPFRIPFQHGELLSVSVLVKGP
jgi:hypothetical protein